MSEDPDDEGQVLATLGLLHRATRVQVAREHGQTERHVAIYFKQSLQVLAPQSPTLYQTVLELHGGTKGLVALVRPARDIAIADRHKCN